MRLFTGIDLSEEVVDRLERLLAQLRPTAHLKWSPVYNLHITTKFIGEWPEQRLEEIGQVLHGLNQREHFDVSVGGLGWFPNPHKPRVFWAGVHGGTALTELAAATASLLEPLGVAQETRPFAPHLTLARITDAAPLQPMRQAIAQLASVEFGSFRAERFHLYLSQPGAAGTVYTKLSEYPLGT